MMQSNLSKRLDAMISDGKGPVLVSFYNGACADGVCGVQNSYMGKLENDLAGSMARFEQVDLDDAPDLIEKYQIATLPSALLFVDGEIYTRLSGLTDPGVLACAMLQHLEDAGSLMARSGHICPLPQIAA